MRILYNANIHTLDADQPHATTLAIDDHAPHAGRILAIGTDDFIQAEFSHRSEAEDMQGRTLIPGLTDAHLHLRSYAHSLDKVDCVTQTRQECLDRVAEKAETLEPDVWLLGHGWNQNHWSEGFGTAADLDAAAPQNPVYLSASSLHAAWANSAALKAAGIDNNTPDPPNGEIQRDAEGNPTGILFESAMQLISGVIPQPSHADNVAAIKTAQEHLWPMGLTGVHDFDRRRSFLALQDLHANGDLQLRVLKHIPVERLDYALGVGLRSGFGDDLLRIGSVKVFMDGALGPHTAAMFAPYEDEPDNRGMLFMDGEELFEYAQQAALGGLGMTVHAIGDRANHETLLAFENLRIFEKQEALSARRHRIEHVQVLDAADLNRLADLDVIASVQPIHATSDMQAVDAYWGARGEHAYAFRTLLEAGTQLAFGSDAPVESPNPFWGIHAAVTRQRADGSPGTDGWYPGQRLSVLEAMQAYTSGAAFAAGMEDRLGMLKAGSLADLLVLDTDPFTSDPSELKDIVPQATMLGGDWVYRA
ncbi:MAG: amidohydrolase [Chloroflexi bacterium]|nr:MAG: amidohydrolase [Chloroflexota bacterium]MBL1195315.1 amidohydrolase [Chloroflexota bacterium]NOH12599.1 amidohydrolase [Chloroflexota bacterium]